MQINQYVHVLLKYIGIALYLKFETIWVNSCANNDIER